MCRAAHKVYHAVNKVYRVALFKDPTVRFSKVCRTALQVYHAVQEECRAALFYSQIVQNFDFRWEWNKGTYKAWNLIENRLFWIGIWCVQMGNVPPHWITPYEAIFSPYDATGRFISKTVFTITWAYRMQRQYWWSSRTRYPSPQGTKVEKIGETKKYTSSGKLSDWNTSGIP